MLFRFLPRGLAAPVACLCWAGAAFADDPPTLAQAVDAAWRLSPQARALENRRAELDARARAASSFFSAPPTLALVQRSGRGAANGASETEAEISAPVALPGLRSATAAQVEAERAALEAQAASGRRRLAVEARELAAQAALAVLEGDAARRKADESARLTQDVERRVRAGESARLDLLRAQSDHRAAQGSVTQAEAALARARAAWRALTGQPVFATLDVRKAASREAPLLAAAEANANAARARLAAAEADRRDPVELGVGWVRERAAAGAPSENALRLLVRIPLGGELRNGARIAAARAELDAAEAEVDAARRQSIAEREAADGELSAADRALELAIERERFATDAQALVVRAHQLGETDLPTRLRADAERFDAEVARARATVETRRALTRLNQTDGAMP